MRQTYILLSLALGLVRCTSDAPPNDQQTDADATDDDLSTPQPKPLTERASEPVVLTGGQLPNLLGRSPADVVAFTFDGARTWTQVPVQIDERLLADFCQVYGEELLGDAAPCKTSLVIKTLFYADPATYTGADLDPTFDLDDELVLMARDAHARWPGATEPSGVVAGSAVELQAGDGSTTGYFYLFTRADSALTSAAGVDLVSYELAFVDVPADFDYRTDYPFIGNGSCGYAPGGDPIPCDPSIVEDSRIHSASYERHFAARWITDGLHITKGTSDGADILDIAQNRFAPVICGRSVSTFSQAEGAFIANVDGPLRAIRSYMGANSGPLTQRTHLFYEGMEVVQTMLRVHPISGIMDLEDYATSATGMTYASSTQLTELAIDGVPDTLASTELPVWELVRGPHGAVLHVLDARNSQELATTSYYLDDANADVANDQCELSSVLTAPDKVAWGQSGSRIIASIPDTDPRNGSQAYVYSTRTSFYEVPTFTIADAQGRVAEAALHVETRAVGGVSCGDALCAAGESCAIDCAPFTGACGDTACDPWENSVNCPSDCGGDTAPSPCGNTVCDVGEHELSCAEDCWSAPYEPFAACLHTNCGQADGACSDEAPCVDYVVCVAECVGGDGSLAACQSECASEYPLSDEQELYAQLLLQCAVDESCAP